MYVCIYIYVYISIYRGRNGETEKETEVEWGGRQVLALIIKLRRFSSPAVAQLGLKQCYSSLLRLHNTFSSNNSAIFIQNNLRGSIVNAVAPSPPFNFNNSPCTLAAELDGVRGKAI